MDHREALRRAIAAAGSQAKLGEAIDARQSLISYWLNHSRHGVSPRYARRIESATGVSAAALCPDVFAPEART